MAFEIGERVTSTWTGPGVVIGPFERDEDNIPVQRVRFDNDGDIRLRPIHKLQPYFEDALKKVKLTDVQKLQRTDPEALKQSVTYGPCIHISCQPSVAARESIRTGIDPRYIKETSELSHGAKYDILFTKPVPAELMSRLSTQIKIADVDIENNRICSLNLALWLISEGVVPILPESRSDGSEG